MKANQELRDEIKQAGLHIYEVADRAGLYETSLTRWLRKDLEGDRLARVRRAVDELKAKKEASNAG